MTYLDLADLNTFLFLSRHIKIFTVPKNNFYYFKKIVIEYFLMLVSPLQRKEFQNWMNNAALKEPEKTNFYNWIYNNPLDIYIPKIPPVGCTISAGWCQGYYNGYVFDITVSIDQRTAYFDKKAHKKISVYLIKEDEKFYEIEAEKKQIN